MTWSNKQIPIKIHDANYVEIRVNVNGAPAVASTSKGRLDIFVRGTDNRLYHNVLVNNEFPANWVDISGNLTFTTSPAAVAWGDNRVDVFAVSTDNKVHHRVHDNDTDWKNHAWDEILEGGTTSHAPAAVSFFSTSFEVFIRSNEGTTETTKGHLKRTTWKGVWAGKWDDLDIGGGLNSAPAAVASAPGTIDFFGVNANGYLEHRREDNGKVNAWTVIERAFTIQDAPAAASSEKAENAEPKWIGRVDVFVRVGNILKHRVYLKNDWEAGNWDDITTTQKFSSAPAAVAWWDKTGTNPNNPNETRVTRIDVFTVVESGDIAKNHDLFHAWWT